MEAQKASGQAGFLYYFDHGYRAAAEAGLHGFHASELPYLFSTFADTPPLWPPVPDTDAERALSRAIGDYWISFARSGIPQAEACPDWPDHALTAGHIRFAGGALSEADLLPGTFAFNDEVIRRRQAAGDLPWNWNVGIAAPAIRSRTST